MKKYFAKVLAIVLAVACFTVCAFAASVSASNSQYKMSGSAAMSGVSGEAATQTSKLSGSTVYSFYAYVAAYASDGSYNDNSKTRYDKGDIMAQATAPGSGTPWRAHCKSYFKPTSSSAYTYMINQYVNAG
jgi:hypothetical protein